MENETTSAWGSYGFSGGVLDIVIRAVNVFMSGEAEEVVMKGVQKVVDVACPTVAVNPSSWFSIFSSIPRPHIPTIIAPLIQPLLTRLSLGFSLVGALSFVSLLISSSLLGPFQLMNNVRIGRGGGIFGWTRRRRVGDGVGVGSVIVVMAVCMGAIRFVRSVPGAVFLSMETKLMTTRPTVCPPICDRHSTIKQLYQLTTDISHYILLKAETAILEVNPKGEVLAVQPALYARGYKGEVVDVADGLDDEFGVAVD